MTTTSDETSETGVFCPSDSVPSLAIILSEGPCWDSRGGPLSLSSSENVQN